MRKPKTDSKTDLKSDAKSGKALDDQVAELLARHRLPDHLRPEETLAHAFTVASTRVSQMLQTMYTERYGLSVIGWRLLAIIGHHAPLAAKELSDLTALDTVTISRALDQLSGKSLLQRRVDPSDRRRTLIRLSKRGQEVYHQVVPVLFAGEAAMLSGLDAEEIATLKMLMQKVVARTAVSLPVDGDWREILETYGVASSLQAPADGAEGVSAEIVPDQGDIP